MKKLIILSALFSVTLILSGCGTTAKFIYPADSKRTVQISNKPAYNLSVNAVELRNPVCHKWDKVQSIDSARVGLAR